MSADAAFASSRSRRSSAGPRGGRLADRAAAVPRPRPPPPYDATWRRWSRAAARREERAAAGGGQGLGRDLVGRLHLADRGLRRLRPDRRRPLEGEALVSFTLFVQPGRTAPP